VVSRVLGSNFSDTITGDGNDNVIEGGSGNDILDGDGGIDTVSYSRAPSGVTWISATGRRIRPGRNGHAVNFENVRG
jgi:Ca2+-binding RTX toxin-like protein